MKSLQPGSRFFVGSHERHVPNTRRDPNHDTGTGSLSPEHPTSDHPKGIGNYLAGKFEMEDDSMPADFSNSADIAAWYDDEFGPKLDQVVRLSADFWATPMQF